MAPTSKAVSSRPLFWATHLEKMSSQPWGFCSSPHQPGCPFCSRPSLCGKEAGPYLKDLSAIFFIVPPTTLPRPLETLWTHHGLLTLP